MYFELRFYRSRSLFAPSESIKMLSNGPSQRMAGKQLDSYKTYSPAVIPKTSEDAFGAAGLMPGSFCGPRPGLQRESRIERTC